MFTEPQTLYKAAFILQINTSVFKRRVGMYEVLRVTLNPFLPRAQSLAARQQFRSKNTISFSFICGLWIKKSCTEFTVLKLLMCS